MSMKVAGVANIVNLGKSISPRQILYLGTTRQRSETFDGAASDKNYIIKKAMR